METKGEIRAFLLNYIQKWPRLELTDLIKLLYQSAFGCGHFAPDEARVLAYLQQELRETQAKADEPLAQAVLGGYARVNIVPYAAGGMKNETLARLFMLTANQQPGDDRAEWFDGALLLLEEMAAAGELPFDAQAVRDALAAYRAKGSPAVHHSEVYRSAYHPAYRIVRAQYAQLLPVFAAIDRLLDRRERVILAIDGNSGAGKSTLADLLMTVYGEASLVHMDDFFLQLHQRTPERFKLPGGNVDHERFLEEVLAPMRRGEAFSYRPFDCARMQIGEEKAMIPGKLCIVEGSYSLHPALESAYDLKIVLRISPAAQAERILERNGPQMLGRFLNEWIPMENLYFEATGIEARADILIGVSARKGERAGYDIVKTEGRT
ncbi:MAG: hypothetical protein IKU34_08660 [Clostridia bacterium]|nr:hypothetical protein [Clostridia bacterium]